MFLAMRVIALIARQSKAFASGDRTSSTPVIAAPVLVGTTRTDLTFRSAHAFLSARESFSVSLHN
jgi:hypothetical protein